MLMIYLCNICSKTSFETHCPWCAPRYGLERAQPETNTQQIPLDPSFYPEFQYKAKGLIKDFLGKKKETAQLNNKLNSVLEKYSELKRPYFANFFYTLKGGGSDSNSAHSLGPRLNGSYSDRELFREVLIRKGFNELEELPHLLDKLLLTTGFSAQYLGFSSEVIKHTDKPIRDALRSWIEESGTRFRDDLCLFFYFCWTQNIKYSELPYSEEASSNFGTPLLPWTIVSQWLQSCEDIYFDILVNRLEIKLENFDPARFVTMYQVDAMNGYDFERFLIELFQTAGYDVEGTKLSGDQGADLFATSFGKKIVIQAKNYSGSVGNSAVQEAISAKGFYACDEAMVVTNSYFTKSAIELATATSVRLVGRTELQKMLDDYNQKIIEQFRLKEIGNLNAESEFN